MLFGKKAPHVPACMVLNLVVAALLLLAAIAALLGVTMTHFENGDTGIGLVLGTMNGSLALIAFALTSTLFLKQLKHCCMKCEVCK